METKKVISDEFNYYLSAPVSMDPLVSEEGYIGVYSERVKNILNKRKEATDADILITLSVATTLSTTLFLGKEGMLFEEVLKYLDTKENLHKEMDLSSEAKKKYNELKKKLFYTTVQYGKKYSSNNNQYLVASRIILSMPKKFIKKVTIPLLLTTVINIFKATLRDEGRNEKIAESVVADAKRLGIKVPEKLDLKKVISSSAMYIRKYIGNEKNNNEEER